MTGNIRKAVITAAGLGTRLLPLTKEVPKEMLPLFIYTLNGISFKPVIQIVFESLHSFGVHEFCFIVGRGKRVIEDYFTPDKSFLDLLNSRDLGYRAKVLKEFYKLIKNAKIFFVNQPEPRGFGDAVLYAEPFVASEPFILHAGDDVVISRGNDHLNRLIKVFQEYNADCVILAEEVEDPKAYGVITGKAVDDLGHILRVLDIVEKPKKPPSNIATIAIYIFKPIIFDFLRRVEPDNTGEIQLTNAIRLMVKDGYRVFAVKLYPHEKRLDVGNPEKYWYALKCSYEYAIKNLLARSR